VISLHLFDPLKHAYVNLRYKDHFERDARSTKASFKVAKHFIAVTRKVHDYYFLTTNVWCGSMQQAPAGGLPHNAFHRYIPFAASLAAIVQE
jgi:hypothetical protein